MPSARIWARLVLAVLVGSAVAATAEAASPSATIAGPAREEWRYSCGGLPYPLSVFDHPPGAEREDTPEARALRRLLRNPRGIETLPSDGWRLAAERGRAVTFTARRPWRRSGMFEVSFRRTRSGRYEYQGSSHWCSPSPHVSGHRVGSWELNPDYPVPGPDATEIEVLVHGTYCSSGEPPLERIRDPLVSYGRSRLVIATVEAPPGGGFHTCEGTPPSEFTFTLREPIGNRIVLDGVHLPFHRRFDLR